MSAFFVLFSEEDDKLLRLSEGICLAIYRNTIRDRIGEGYGIAALKQPKKIDPLRPEINFVGGVVDRENSGTRFACVKIN